MRPVHRILYEGVIFAYLIVFGNVVNAGPKIAPPDVRLPRVSDCPIIRQEDNYPFIRVWQDCDEDGVADRECIFKWNSIKREFDPGICIKPPSKY
jgi:hypothetical protein